MANQRSLMIRIPNQFVRFITSIRQSQKRFNTTAPSYNHTRTGRRYICRESAHLTLTPSRLQLKGGGAKQILKPENPSGKMRMSVQEAKKWFLAQVRLQVLNVPHCLGRVFAVMDPDHSGSIDTEELREGLRKIGLWLKEDELRQLFQVLPR